MAAVALSYVLGSVPTDLWLGRWLRGVDIREHGSKNIGATNTLRVLGKGLGAAALAGDMAKGMIPVLCVGQVTPWPYAPLACGVAAILGHIFSFFLRFAGGKGLATSAGVFLALCPLPTLVGAAAFFLVVWTTRMVSAGSLTAASVMVLAAYLLPYEWATYPTRLLPNPWVLRILGTLVAILIFWRHRSNIQRILKGEENRF